MRVRILVLLGLFSLSFITPGNSADDSVGAVRPKAFYRDVDPSLKAHYQEVPEEITTAANTCIPDRDAHYKADEVLDFFKGIAFPDAFSYLTDVINALYSFGEPPHPTEVVNKRIRCLWSKFMIVNSLFDKPDLTRDVPVNTQICAVNELIESHRMHLTSENIIGLPERAFRPADLPIGRCPKCSGHVSE